MSVPQQLILCFSIAWMLCSCYAKVLYKVRCSEDWMTVDLLKTDDVTAVYLEQLKHYPDPACRPEIEENRAIFKLSLKDVFQCGVTRVHNRITGRRIYYHRVVIESENQERPKEIILAKCIMGPVEHHHPFNHTIHRRNVLPAGFQEPEDLEITTSLTKVAPEPILNVGVRQGGQLVTGELNVNPGTPLQMEIYLDSDSAPIYGLLVSYMQVTDTKRQEETIIFNGCSVDPYLFENFNTVDGDFLSAKFRAFKFPESSYVQFKGTVNVCLDKCRGVECSNGQIGFGRRKREVSELPPDPNKMFEVTMTTFLKVDYDDAKLYEKATLVGMMKPDKNESSNQKDHLKISTEELHEEFHYTVIEKEKLNSGSSTIPSCAIIIFTMIASMFQRIY